MPNAISVSALNDLIGAPDCPAIVDICTPEDHADDPYLIPGAFRYDFADPASLAPLLDGRTAVIVCQKGLKLSQGFAAWLRSDGQQAVYLQGGMYGWRDHPKTCRVPATALQGAQLWVTTDRLTPDLLASAWLITRFAHTDARFLLVEAGEIASVADRFSAQPLDPVKSNNFRILMDLFHVKYKPLAELENLLQDQSSPLFAGIHTLCDGLTRLRLSQTELLPAAYSVFDALYAHLRDGYECVRQTTGGQ